MMKIRKNCPVSMQSRLILLRFVKHILHTLQPPKSVVVSPRGKCFTNLSHLRYRLLMIQDSSFLVCIYILDGGLPYYIELMYIDSISGNCITLLW